mmetsp:Transcript_12627/g.21585  ORF Transcript_12627/g.21585 Transcript_12627/m.21585 type:complete len:230 (+) Transcript_12627:263-952(+)
MIQMLLSVIRVNKHDQTTIQLGSFSYQKDSLNVQLRVGLIHDYLLGGPRSNSCFECLGDLFKSFKNLRVHLVPFKTTADSLVEKHLGLVILGFHNDTQTSRILCFAMLKGDIHHGRHLFHRSILIGVINPKHFLRKEETSSEIHAIRPILPTLDLLRHKITRPELISPNLRIMILMIMSNSFLDKVRTTGPNLIFATPCSFRFIQKNRAQHLALQRFINPSPFVLLFLG